jgi:cell division protein FtsL
MTPPAVTSAGRGSASKSKPPGSGDGHPRKLRRQPAPRSPRRVSGPLGGRRAAEVAAAVAGGGTIAIPTRPARPARPARTSRQTRRAARSRTSSATLPIRAAAFVRGLPDHAVIDRLVRGRAWIPVLGLLLTGIVAMQVSMLKLNASIGRSIERGTALQSENQQLRASVATLADDQRIERIAAGMGMIMPAPAAVGFLSAQPAGGIGQSVANIKTPDAATFLASLPAATATDPLTGLSASAGTGTSSALTPSTASASVTPALTPTATGTTATSGSTGTATGATGTGTAATTATGATSPPTVSSTASGTSSTGSSGGASGVPPAAGTGASTGAGISGAASGAAAGATASGGGVGIQSQSNGG